MRLVLCLCIAFTLVPLSTPAAQGQSSVVFLEANGCIADPFNPGNVLLFGPGPVQIVVRALVPGGATQFDFAIPGWNVPNLGVLVSPNLEMVVIDGNPFAGGARYGFPECVGGTEPVTLCTATLLVFAPAISVPWTVGPSPFVPGATCGTASPCGGEPPVCLEAAAPGVVPVHSPTPAHGATDVSLDAQLSFLGGIGSCACLGTPCTTVWFGTTPDPPLFHSSCDGQPPMPGLQLQRNTTYYWRVERNFCGTLAGPTWSFTTDDFIGVEPSTWSNVKAYYR